MHIFEQIKKSRQYQLTDSNEYIEDVYRMSLECYQNLIEYNEWLNLRIFPNKFIFKTGVSPDIPKKLPKKFEFKANGWIWKNRDLRFVTLVVTNKQEVG